MAHDPSLWSLINGIILGSDEFINTYARLEMHGLDLCMSNQDVVEPLHKIIF